MYVYIYNMKANMIAPNTTPEHMTTARMPCHSLKSQYAVK